MKVLYISGMYPNPTYPQKGIFCHEQVKALKQIGVDVDVVVPMTVYDKEYTTKTWEYQGVIIRYIRYIKYPGVKFFEHIGKSLFFSLTHSDIDFTKYDVIHADAPLPAGDAAKRISKKFNIPYVVHGHGLDVFSEESYKDAKNCKAIVDVCVKAYNDANAVIGVSQKVVDRIQRRIDVSGKSYVAYNGVDTDSFFPIEHHNDKLCITSIGNLIPLKGHEYTLRAVKALVDKGYTNIEFKLAGRGYLEENLKKLTSELKLDDYVSFMGYIPYDKVTELLQNSDIFVLPSYYEALGCVYLEAMACGVPAVGCYENGIDEVITNRKNGYLVHGKSTEEIVRVLIEYINEENKSLISKQAIITVKEHYKWTDSALTLKEIYGRILN